MSVSPADFALYSRVTGTPIPRTPAERMRLAPTVQNFIRQQGYAQQGNFLQDIAGNLLKVGAIGAAGLGAATLAGAAAGRSPGSVIGGKVLRNYGEEGTVASPPQPQNPPSGGGSGVQVVDLGSSQLRDSSVVQQSPLGDQIRFSGDIDESSPYISRSEPSSVVTNQTKTVRDARQLNNEIIDQSTETQAEALSGSTNPLTQQADSLVNQYQPALPEGQQGTEGTVTLESDYDAGNVRTYQRDVEDPRLALPESPIDSRGRIALSRDPIGRARGQLEKFADDIRIEQYVPYTSVPLAGGVAWHQLSDAAAILGGQDAATLANPVARTVTELGNRAGGAFLRNDPTMGAISKGVQAATDATTNTLDFLGNIGFRGHSVGDLVNWAATHAPAHEGVGNVLEAVGHMAHTMPLEVGLGAAGIAGGTALLGAGRAGWRARHNVDPKGESRLFPTKWERDARIDPYSVTYDRYLKEPVDKARQFASDFTVSLRPVDNPQLNDRRGPDQTNVSPGQNITRNDVDRSDIWSKGEIGVGSQVDSTEEPLHGKGLNPIQRAISRPFDAAQRFIEKQDWMKDQMRIAELEESMRRGRADLSPDQQKEVAQQLFEREKGAQGTAFTQEGTPQGPATYLVPDKQNGSSTRGFKGVGYDPETENLTTYMKVSPGREEVEGTGVRGYETPDVTREEGEQLTRGAETSFDEPEEKRSKYRSSLRAAMQRKEDTKDK